MDQAVASSSLDLSIVLVHFHAPELLMDCIRSITETTKCPFEIIVVDNGPEQGLESKCRQVYPSLQWIDMGYNAGFARANNAGIRIAKGEHVLLLNSDTLVHPGSLDAACKRFAEDKKAVACGVKLIDRDGNLQISGSFFTKGGLNFLLPLPYLGAAVKWLGYTLKTKVPHVAVAGNREEVDWINGAFLMVKQSVLPAAGLMDEDFFLYAEETEWCSRLKKQGDMVVYGDIAISHLEGGSSQQFFGTHAKGYYSLTDKRGRQLMVSNLLRIRKQFGAAWFLFMLAIYTAEFPVFLIGNILTLPMNLKQIGVWISEPFRYLGNLSCLLNLTPRMLRGRPHFYKVL